MSMTSVFGRRHPPIAFSRHPHPASRCNPSRSTSTPSFADHAATRRDSVGCEGRRPPSPIGAVPARSLVASRNAGSSRSSVASLCSRRPCPASSRSVPRQPPLRMPDPAPVPLVRQPLRQKPHHPAAPQQLAPRQRPRIPRDPVPAGPDPDRSVEAERRIHYLHLRRDGWRVLAILLTH